MTVSVSISNGGAPLFEHDFGTRHEAADWVRRVLEGSGLSYMRVEVQVTDRLGV